MRRIDKADAVITDLRFNYEGSEADVERFLHECVGKRIPVIVYSAGKWVETISKPEGCIVMSKMNNTRDVMEALQEALEQALAEKAKRPAILIVEDDADIRDDAAEHFRENSFDVIPCADIREALARLPDVDVVLTDVQFEGTPPCEVERFLQACTDQKIPLIVFSGGEWDSVPRGAVILHKPMRWKKVQAAVEKALAQKAAVVAPLDIARLARPDYHPMSPMQKAAGRDTELAEWLRVKKELDSSYRHGDWPKRDLEAAMASYQRASRRLFST